MRKLYEKLSNLNFSSNGIGVSGDKNEMGGKCGTKELNGNVKSLKETTSKT